MKTLIFLISLSILPLKALAGDMPDQPERCQRNSDGAHYEQCEGDGIPAYEEEDEDDSEDFGGGQNEPGYEDLF